MRAVEEGGLLARKVYYMREVPPGVEYNLTETGYSLKPIMDVMAAWGQNGNRRTAEKIAYILVSAAVFEGRIPRRIRLHQLQVEQNPGHAGPGDNPEETDAKGQDAEQIHWKKAAKQQEKAPLMSPDDKKTVTQKCRVAQIRKIQKETEGSFQNQSQGNIDGAARSQSSQSHNQPLKIKVAGIMKSLDEARQKNRRAKQCPQGGEEQGFPEVFPVKADKDISVVTALSAGYAQVQPVQACLEKAGQDHGDQKSRLKEANGGHGITAPGYRGGENRQDQGQSKDKQHTQQDQEGKESAQYQITVFSAKPILRTVLQFISFGMLIHSAAPILHNRRSYRCILPGLRT